MEFFHFALKRGWCGDSGGAGPAAGPGEGGQCVQRLGGGGITAQQAAIGNRADPFGAGEAESVEAVGGGGVGQLDACCRLEGAGDSDRRAFSVGQERMLAPVLRAATASCGLGAYQPQREAARHPAAAGVPACTINAETEIAKFTMAIL